MVLYDFATDQYMGLCAALATHFLASRRIAFICACWSPALLYIVRPPPPHNARRAPCNGSTRPAHKAAIAQIRHPSRRPKIGCKGHQNNYNRLTADGRDRHWTSAAPFNQRWACGRRDGQPFDTRGNTVRAGDTPLDRRILKRIWPCDWRRSCQPAVFDTPAPEAD